MVGKHLACAILGVCGGLVPVGRCPAADHVIHISVDGLRPDAVTTLGPAGAPNFYRFRTEGAFTDNARTDYDYTNTLPNHTSQLTSRPVLDRLGTNSGHRYTDNGAPEPNETLHTKAGYYVASAFDVAHDAGLKTGLYATKPKFVLYDQSFNATTGAPDVTGADNGRDKIDVYVNPGENSPSMMSSLLANLSNPATRTNYTFVHFHNLDEAGHDNGWDLTEPPLSPYLNAARTVDGFLGQLFNLVTTDPALAGNTAIVLTADHGGSGTGHGGTSTEANYTIPFYVWGDGILPGDLYAMNPSTRLGPEDKQPAYSAPLQPIRNGDAANLALDLLGLGPVPGSGINASQNLIVPEPTGGMFVLLAAGFGLCVRRTRRSGSREDTRDT